MIPERTQWSAVPIDGGERVTGYLVDKDLIKDSTKGVTLHTTDMGVYGEYKCCIIRIDPETIEPVKVKPIFVSDAGSAGAIYCPNCDYDLMGGVEMDAEHDPPHCWECGQALDWES